MIIDVIADQVSLCPQPEDYRFTLSHGGNTVALDVFKSMLSNKIHPDGQLSMSIYDVFVFKRTLQELDQWNGTQITERAQLVMIQHLHNLLTLKEIKEEGKNNDLILSDLKTKPYKDQKAGVAFHLAMDRSLNSSAMGLGKTLTALCWYHNLRQRGMASKVLVLCKNGGKNVWKNEIAKHTNYTCEIAGNGTDGVLSSLEDYYASKADFFILHYDCLSARRAKGQTKKDKPQPAKMHEALLTSSFDTMIFDEAHKLKHSQASRTQAVFDVVHKVNPRKMLLMTGTPVAEAPENAYTLLKLLKPAIVPTKTGFLNRFTIREWVKRGKRKVFDITGYQHLDDLRDLLSWVSYRKTQDEVEGMPPTVFKDIPVDMGQEQAKLYNAISEQVYKEISAIPTNAINLDVVAVKLIRLRQLLTHPFLLGESAPSCKFDECDDLLEELMDDREAKVILWSDMQQAVELLAHRYNDQYKTAFIHGGVPIPVRNEIERRFTNDKYPRVLVCSPGAAGDSLNLQRARTSIYVSRPVSLTDYQQSLNRICRREAKGTSIIMHIVVPNTIDDWLTALLTKKQNMSEALTIGEQQLTMFDKAPLLDILKRRVKA